MRQGFRRFVDGLRYGFYRETWTLVRADVHVAYSFLRIKLSLIKFRWLIYRRVRDPQVRRATWDALRGHVERRMTIAGGRT